MLHRTLLVGIFGLLSIDAGTTQELASLKDRRALGAFALQLARIKDPAADTLLPKLIAELGADASEIAALRQRLAKAAARAKSPKRIPSSLAKTAARLGTRLASKLDTLAEGPRKRLARVVLALDGRVATAHRSLGHRLVEGRWISEANQATTKRRLDILRKIAAARSLELDVVVRESKHDMLTKDLAAAKPGSCSTVNSHSIVAYPKRPPSDSCWMRCAPRLLANGSSRASRAGILRTAAHVGTGPRQEDLPRLCRHRSRDRHGRKVRRVRQNLVELLSPKTRHQGLCLRQ